MAQRKSPQTKKNPLTGEDAFRLLFLSHPIPMLVIDLKTLALLDINDAALKKYKYTRDEFLKLNLGDIHATEHSGEQRHRLKNGKVIDMEVTSHPFEFAGQKALLVMAQDITLRKQAEAAALESKLTAEQYLNIIAEIIVSLDSEGNVTRLNESGYQLLGYEEGLIGRNWFDTCIPEEERDEVRSFFGMLRNGEIQSMETRENSVITKSGEKKIILWHNTILRDQGDRFMGILSSGENITERMEMEKASRIALAKYKVLFESFPLGITIADEAGNILETNPTAEKLLAIPREEHSQRSIDGAEWRIVRPDGTPLPPEEYTSVRALKEKRMVENVEQGVIKPDQSTVWLNVTAAPLPPDGRGVVITYSDITARKRAEQALKATNMDLEASLVREKELAHTDMLTGVNNRRYLYVLAAHEFDIATRYRQPLSMLMFDFDHFKKINDTFGHAIGDQMLKLVTQTACAKLRSTDAIGRYGGEEFVILLPMTTAQQAFSLAERIRESVAQICVPTPIGDAAVTISIGIVEMIHSTGQSESLDDLIRRADQAMYAAKQSGRNCSVIFNSVSANVTEDKSLDGQG